MSNIPTAEEFLIEKCNTWKDGEYVYADYVSPETLIEFAKLHVEAALNNASFNYLDAETKKKLELSDIILNAYPLTNIK